jgi:hypothetical protein
MYIPTWGAFNAYTHTHVRDIQYICRYTLTYGAINTYAHMYIHMYACIYAHGYAPIYRQIQFENN